MLGHIISSPSSVSTTVWLGLFPRGRLSASLPLKTSIGDRREACLIRWRETSPSRLLQPSWSSFCVRGLLSASLTINTSVGSACFVPGLLPLLDTVPTKPFFSFLTISMKQWETGSNKLGGLKSQRKRRNRFRVLTIGIVYLGFILWAPGSKRGYSIYLIRWVLFCNYKNVHSSSYKKILLWITNSLQNFWNRYTPLTCSGNLGGYWTDFRNYPKLSEIVLTCITHNVSQ